MTTAATATIRNATTPEYNDLEAKGARLSLSRLLTTRLPHRCAPERQDTVRDPVAEQQSGSLGRVFRAEEYREHALRE
jgi:hypothetical protein